MIVHMPLSRWTKWITQWGAKQARPRRSRSVSGPAMVEQLELRRLLSTITVTTTTDNSNDGDTSSISALLAHPGTDRKISLREAILAANNTGGSNTIQFDPLLTAQGPVTISPSLVGDVTADRTGRLTTMEEFWPSILQRLSMQIIVHFPITRRFPRVV